MSAKDIDIAPRRINITKTVISLLKFAAAVALGGVAVHFLKHSPDEDGAKAYLDEFSNICKYVLEDPDALTIQDSFTFHAGRKNEDGDVLLCSCSIEGTGDVSCMVDDNDDNFKTVIITGLQKDDLAVVGEQALRQTPFAADVQSAVADVYSMLEDQTQ